MLYLSRALKCFLKLAVLLTVIFAVMNLTGTLETGGLPLAKALFGSVKGILLLGLIVVWSAVYPLVSFMRTSVRMQWDDSGERLVNAFAGIGYVLEGETEGRMTFRTRSVLRRVMWQFDDRVTVAKDGGFISIEGLKKVVPRVETRLKAGL